MDVSSNNQTFLEGNLVVQQQPSGYRFSIDAILLASFISPKPYDHIVDLGTGCGIIPLLIAKKNNSIQISGVEIQQELAELATSNIAANSLIDRIQVIHGDIKSIGQFFTAGSIDIVVTNPPYRKHNSGRINPNHQKAIARHEIMLTLEELVQATAYLLKTGGKCSIIYSSERMTDLLTLLRYHHIEPKRMTLIHSQLQEPAIRIVVQAVKNALPGLTIDPPIAIYKETGEYTEKVTQMFISAS
ncbi:MAG: tRNA1(Val) (adenine(37)-N6)-methyltransferase [Desulfobacterales bacterium]|nr:tRNA1(Val) (adenine(37)-N6)-methyltransferase [Desulfobacterales bacterium]